MKRVILLLMFLLLGQVVVIAQSRGIEFYKRATKLVEESEFTAALDLYDQAISAEPENPLFVYEKGRCYLNLKDYVHARQCFEKAIVLKENYVNAHRMLAYMNATENQLDAAIAEYEKAYNYEDSVAGKLSYKLEIIQLLDKNGKPEQALKHLVDARNLHIDHPMLFYFDGKINNQVGNYPNARESLLRSIELISASIKKKEEVKKTGIEDKFAIRINRPEDLAKYYFELFYSYYQLEQYGEAKKIVNRANYAPYKEALREMTPEYIYSQAYSYFRIYEFEQSKSLLNKVLLMEKKYTPAYELLARIARMQVDASATVREYERAIAAEKEIDRKDSLYSRMLKLEAGAGQYKKLLAAADDYIRLRPVNPEAMFLKAVALGKTGKRREAIEILQALVNSPDVLVKPRSEYNFLIGVLARQEGDFKTARAAFDHINYYFFRNAARGELKKMGQEEAKK